MLVVEPLDGDGMRGKVARRISAAARKGERDVRQLKLIGLGIYYSGTWGLNGFRHGGRTRGRGWVTMAPRCINSPPQQLLRGLHSPRTSTDDSRGRWSAAGDR